MTTETDNGAPEGVTEDLAAPETVLEAQEDAQPGDDAAAPTEGEGEQPKRKTVQDRIDELTADKHHLRRENEDLPRRSGALAATAGFAPKRRKTAMAGRTRKIFRMGFMTRPIWKP